MKAAFYQPEYPNNYEQTVGVINQILDITSNQIDDVDLLVLPEYSNCAGMNNMDEIKIHIKKYNESYLNSLIKNAKKSRTHISVNILLYENDNYYNVTIFISNTGKILATYKKTHLAYPEKYTMGIKEGDESLFIEVDNVKYSFATCFELYFSEYFEYIASNKPDIIIVPSYQRSELTSILKTQINARALDAEAYVIRASYSMGNNSLSGGYSQISSPDGEAILKAEQNSGLFKIDINPHKKRERPLAHGLDKLTSREIIDNFRRPSLYRQGGSFVREIENYKYPRICAHRGLSHACPENTIPAFLGAIAVGADEIEFDLRVTKDGHIVLCHDASIDRTTTGNGNVSDLTFKQIREADAGIYLNKEWEGIKIPTIEEVFHHCAGLIVMNIHIYDPGTEGFVVKEISRLSNRYNSDKFIYLAGDKKVLESSLKYAPHLERACLESQQTEEILYYTEKYQCQRLQFARNVTDKMIEHAKKLGVVCNLFYTDDEKEAIDFTNRGIDTILTNKAIKIIKALK